MRRFRYYAGGKLHSMQVTELVKSQDRRIHARRRKRGGRGVHKPEHVGRGVTATLKAQHKRLSARFHDISEETVLSTPVQESKVTIIPTESVVIDGARSNETRWLWDKFGMEIVQEGRCGKVLLQAPEGEQDGVAMAFSAARQLVERGQVGSAHPNFLRAIQRPRASPGEVLRQWNLDNLGRPGLIGADVHALATWTITRGDHDVRVAVLDEGVDTRHPDLKDVIIAEADFVDDHVHARPDGDDAHGTACAGIIASQDDEVQGLASGLSLIAVRIAKSDNYGFWIFDDFDTADAIDWAWDEAGADVLSNSWGGGPPADVITRAFERARTLGRNRKGAVVVVAAGNDQKEIDYPGNLPGVLTVGASNQWDERKTKSSKDGEDWWGSNYGDSLDLLAPGVKIATMDIRGGRGYSSGLFTGSFNGTSAAAPHVAAAAGLILSVANRLSELRVREILIGKADPQSRDGKWNKFVGHGRLNTYAALRAARRD